MSASEIAITARGLSKLYRIGQKQQVRDSLAATMFDFVRSPLRNYRKYRSLYRFDDVMAAQGAGAAQAPMDVIWALRDVSFEVRQGEVVGVIGRNGAGKSTLLKILTKITPPTQGEAEIRGRVASLLEVGTGFHQELTGRENIYLNGTILGMTKREVDRKFDEIVDFSGVERFIDTPVKRYSSGMAVRLAFAVAAHLEPEILIVDEVLAVGDAAFQKKCLNKMQDVRKQGRTVLLVSHNMASVSALCSRAFLLNEGRMIQNGPVHDVVHAYFHAGGGTRAARFWSDAGSAPGGDCARLRSVRVVSSDGATVDAVSVRDKFGIEMAYDVLQAGVPLLPHFYLYNEEGAAVFGTLDHRSEQSGGPKKLGRHVSTVWIPANFLSAGTFFVTCSLITRSPDRVQFDENQVIAFSVLDALGDGTARGSWSGEMPGVVRPLLEWTTLYQADVDVGGKGV